ncbi:tRNA (cytosine(34)-C(5))-methyltransferase-like protein, partial [Leptotrombidium deliense]
MGRRKRQSKNAKRGDDRDKTGNDKKVGYEDIERKNENFETYYKLQNIVPEEDWDKFMSTLRENLPAAFRLTNSAFNQTLGLRNVIESKEFAELFASQSLISTLKWYPNKCAFQTKLSRVEIRKSESLQRLHSFLLSETDSGNISRQEAVSMIPPLLLDVRPGQTVLDMCAAPGSKTAQIIEMLHAD